MYTYLFFSLAYFNKMKQRAGRFICLQPSTHTYNQFPQVMYANTSWVGLGLGRFWPMYMEGSVVWTSAARVCVWCVCASE